LSLHKSIAEVPAQDFDWVYTAHTLEHFTDLSTIFRDIANCLRPGGLLLVEVPNFDFFRFGAACLTAVGAVHPLGLCSDFFQRNLPTYGFAIQGFYDRWEQFPHQPQETSTGDVVILLAQKL
ncbi:MAG: methyltransferase domain-containing protein, partial [Pseudanabaenaceae cyanobacterium]